MAGEVDGPLLLTVAGETAGFVLSGHVVALLYFAGFTCLPDLTTEAVIRPEICR